MAKLKIETVWDAMMSWNYRFTETVRSNDVLEMLCIEYHEDLVDEGVTEGAFMWAGKEARKRCEFFPKMANILTYVEQYRRNPPRNALAIPETTSCDNPTPKEEEASKRRIAIIQRVLCNNLKSGEEKISWEEATELLEQENLLGNVVDERKHKTKDMK